MAFNTGGNFDIQPIPGGMMYCMCDQGSDDCVIDMNIADGLLIYFCAGQCGCLKFSVCDDLSKVRQYETPGGEWFNL
jgi:hypothetical protein